MALEATDFADLVASTLKELGPYNAVQQIAQNKQRYEVLSRWFKDDKTQLDSGVAIQRQLMVGDGTGGPATHNAPTDEDVVNLADILKTITVPWRHAITSWMVIRQHLLMNRKPSAILNNIEAQRNWSMLSLHDEMENKAWAAAPASTNVVDPWGVKYWIVQHASTGFNGGSPTGDNLIAGLNLSTLPVTGQFSNYTALYTTLTPADGMPKLRTAHRKCGFISPVTMQDYMTGSGDNYRLYCNETSITAFEEICMANADLSLRDVASVDGLNLSFKKNPIVWISALDADTDDPIYMINHSVFEPVGLEGDYMHETRNSAPLNHNIEQYFVDLSYNYKCIDRRRCAVLATS